MVTPRLVTFAHISDTHLHVDTDHTSEMIDYPALPSVQALIQQINTFPAEIDLVLHTGDIMHHPESAADYQIAQETFAQLKFPVHYIPGNHDRVAWVQQMMLERAGADLTPHTDYEFEHNGVQFVMLDSHRPEDEEGAHGHFSPAQLNWLDARCSAADPRPLVVGVHHHTLPLEAPWLDRIGFRNGIVFHNTLLKARDRLRGVFYGHIHESTVTVREGIAYYSAQSAWFQTRTYHDADAPLRDEMREPGFNLVTLTERDTFVRFIRTPLNG